MSEPVEVVVHEIATDGLPDMDQLTGRVAFIFDGCIVSGWPLNRGPRDQPDWEADSDVGRNIKFRGVTHWVEFPVPLWEIGQRTDSEDQVSTDGRHDLLAEAIDKLEKIRARLDRHQQGHSAAGLRGDLYRILDGTDGERLIAQDHQ